MKATWLVSLVCFISATAFSQNLKSHEVPYVILDRFAILYPDAKQVQWEYQTGMYHVKFRNRKLRGSAMFYLNGEVQQTETGISVTALPKKASTFLTDKVQVKKIQEAVIVEDEAGTITFLAEADHIAYQFDHVGELIGRKEL